MSRVAVVSKHRVGFNGEKARAMATWRGCQEGKRSEGYCATGMAPCRCRPRELDALRSRRFTA